MYDYEGEGQGVRGEARERRVARTWTCAGGTTPKSYCQETSRNGVRLRGERGSGLSPTSNDQASASTARQMPPLSVLVLRQCVTGHDLLRLEILRECEFVK